MDYQPQRTILFAAWGAQELGQLDSVYYAGNPTFPLTNTLAMIQLDGVGGGDGFAPGIEADVTQDGLLISGMETAVGLLDEKLIITPELTPNDHLSFAEAGFPSLLVAWRLAGEDNLSDEFANKTSAENLSVSGRATALLLMSLAQ